MLSKKKIYKKIHMLWLYFINGKVCCIQKTLKVAPEMAASLSDKFSDTE